MLGHLYLERTVKTGKPEQDSQDEIGRTGQTELDRQNMIARTRLLGQKCKNSTVRIGRPDRTTRTELPEQDSQDRTART